MAGTGGAGEGVLMRPDEVAAVFGVTTKTVGRWARSGTLRSVRTPGGHMRFYASEIFAHAALETVRRLPASELPVGVRTPPN